MRSQKNVALSFDNQLKIFLNHLKYQPEEISLNDLKKIIADFGKESFQKMASTALLLIETKTHEQIRTTMLYYAVIRNFKQLAAALLQLNIPVDAGTQSKIYPEYDQISPLQIAVQLGHEEIVQLLLEHHANFILGKNQENILMVAKTPAMRVFLLQKAKERGCFDELLETKNWQLFSVYEEACFSGHPEIMKELMVFKHYKTLDLRLLLHTARYAYWIYPEKGDEFNEICLQLKAEIKMDQYSPVLDFNKHTPDVGMKECGHLLFGGQYDALQPAKNREEAIKKVTSQFYSFLKSPKKCIKYLKFLNDELVRYFEEKYKCVFPGLDPSSYEFKVIDGTYYPIPQENYIGIKKHSALQEFLILFFRKYNLAENIYQWIGVAPEREANEAVKKGDFVMEDRVGGLLHTKIAHMLQFAILLCIIQDESVIQDEKIDLSFSSQEAGKSTLAVRDIFEALVTLEISNQEAYLWNEILDQRFFNIVQFSDPYRLSSIIMHEGKSLGMTALSDYLIDTFCKGFVHRFIAHHLVPQFSHLSKEDFIEKMNEMKSEFNDVPSYLLQYSVNRAEGKAPYTTVQQCQFFSHSGYAIVKKEYDTKNDFEVRSFNVRK